MGDTNNVLHSSVKKLLCPLWSLSLAEKSCKSRQQPRAKFPDYVISYDFDLKQRMFTINNKKEPPEVFYKKPVLKHLSILTGKCLCSSLFLITLRPFRSATFLKRDFNAGVFCEYCEILKNAYFKENL